MSFLLLSVLLGSQAVNKCLIQAMDVFGSVRLWGELTTQDTLGVVSCLRGFIEQREY